MRCAPVILEYRLNSRATSPRSTGGSSPTRTGSCSGCASGCSSAPSRAQAPSIRVLAGDWVGAEREDVENLLKSVARELWVYFPGRTLKPILVAPTERHPIAGYAKGPDGEYFVYLSAKGRHWSQYAYQFAHEFAHILSNYERHGRTHVRRNQWFDESLCETASLFTLRRLGASWLKGDMVPYPHWRTYGAAMQTYVRDLLAQPHRSLPPKSAFADWYQGNADALDRNPYLREREAQLVAWEVAVPPGVGELEWRAELPNHSLARIQEGAPARILLDDGHAIEATVRLVAPTIDAQTRNGQVHVALPRGAALKAGGHARGEILVASAQALAIPESSVLARDGYAFVYTLGPDKVARLTRIETGARQQGLVEVSAGLRPETRVIGTGAGFVKDGDLVRIAPMTAQRSVSKGNQS